MWDAINRALILTVVIVAFITLRMLTIFSTKLFPPHISSFSLLLHVTYVILSQSSVLGPLDNLHWLLFLQPSVYSSLRITSRSFRHGAPHLWNKLLPTLRVSYQSGASSSLSLCVSSSRSDPGPTVDISHGVFHFSQNFPSIAMYSFVRLISWTFDHSSFGSHWRRYSIV